MLDTDKIHQLIKKGVKDKNFPQYVYKYRATLDQPRFESILTTNSMYFASPPTFNDPFDCQLQPVLSPSRTETEAFINRMLPGLSEADKQPIIDQAINNPERLAEIIKNAINFDNYGVLCLSKEPDNILLWSHYAANHQGACLKFDILKDLDFFSSPLNVKYETVYPNYNHFTDHGQVVEMMIKTKYKLWVYEKELRILKFKNGPFQFRKTALTEIIFGCNTPANEITRIQNLASANNYPHLVYKKAEKKENAYGIILNTI